jgi:uncharacterized oxidoreductase
VKLEGKSALVTGSTDGIGAELAHRLRAKGASVVVNGRDPGLLEVARAEGFEAIAADLSGPAGIDALVDGFFDRPLDILVNNAGASARYDVNAPVSLAEVDRCLFLNLHAPIHLVTRLLPRLRERPEAMIVNVTSGLAIAPRANSPVYCARKAGLRSFTMALRAQLAETDVRVLEVLPPVVETRLTAANRFSKVPASECARRIVATMERNRDEANIGAVRALRLLYSLSPALARRLMLRA